MDTLNQIGMIAFGLVGLLWMAVLIWSDMPEKIPADVYQPYDTPKTKMPAYIDFPLEDGGFERRSMAPYDTRRWYFPPGADKGILLEGQQDDPAPLTYIKVSEYEYD